jgi:hypothetical protein
VQLDTQSHRTRLVVALLATATVLSCAESKPSRETPAATASSVVPAAAAVTTAPLGAPSARVAEVVPVCRALCEHTSSLGCPARNECLDTCVGMAAATPCTGAVVALYECLRREPLSRWECAEDGAAAIRDGSCDDEQSRAVHCLETEVKP